MTLNKLEPDTKQRTYARTEGDFVRHGRNLGDGVVNHPDFSAYHRISYFLDCTFLSIVVVSSAALYFRHLGFYEDDWQYWAGFSKCSDQSLHGLFSCGGLGVSDLRPLYRLYLAALFRAFGTNPTGSHVTMLAVSVLMILSLYVALRELALPRFLGVTVALIYALLPHYNTDAFWISAGQTTLSMMFYFLSVWSALRALRARLSVRWWWAGASIALMFASALSYEVAIPLFALTPVLLWYRSRVPKSRRAWIAAGQQSNFVLFSISGCAAVGAGASKLFLQDRVHYHFGFVDNLRAVADHAALQAVNFNFGKYGAEMPRTLWKVCRDYPNGNMFVLGGVLAAFVLGYLLWIGFESDADLPSKWECAALAGAGIVIFGLAFAPFSVNLYSDIAASDGRNRIAIAAALGTAMLQVGLLGWVAGWLPMQRLKKTVFCTAIAICLLSGFLVNNTLASFWVRGAEAQRSVLADVRERFPVLTGKTLILEGACTYIGPAPVFATNFDLAGALQVLYRDPSIRADVPGERIEAGKEFLSIWNSGEESQYHYGDNLIIYDFKRKVETRLTNADAAARYFQFDAQRGAGCSPEWEPF